MYGSSYLPEIKSEFYEIIPMTEIRNDGADEGFFC